MPNSDKERGKASPKKSKKPKKGVPRTDSQGRPVLQDGTPFTPLPPDHPDYLPSGHGHPAGRPPLSAAGQRRAIARKAARAKRAAEGRSVIPRPITRVGLAGGFCQYDIEMAARICQRMCEGESLREICRDPTMPSMSAILTWLADDNPKFDAFRDMYGHARTVLMEHWADETLSIADDSSNDWIERQTKDGRMERMLDPENVNRSRLRVDTRKWILSKLAPRKYGDKVDVSVGGRDGRAIPMAVVTMTAEEAERAYLNMVNGDADK